MLPTRDSKMDIFCFKSRCCTQETAKCIFLCFKRNVIHLWQQNVHFKSNVAHQWQKNVYFKSNAAHQRPAGEIWDANINWRIHLLPRSLPKGAQFNHLSTWEILPHEVLNKFAISVDVITISENYRWPTVRLLVRNSFTPWSNARAMLTLERHIALV